MLLSLWLPLALIVTWWLISANSTDLFFPSLASIWEEMWTNLLGPSAPTTVLESLARLSIGFALATFLGLVVGYFVGLTPLGRAMLEPVLDFFRATPVIALIPVFIAMFGIGILSEVLLIAWAGVWPTLLGTIAGVAGTDSGYRDAAASMRFRTSHSVFLLRLPSAAPMIMSGINLSLSISVIAMVGVELYTAAAGIGRYLSLSKLMFNMPAAYAGAIVSGLIGFVAVTLFYVVERRLLIPWHHKMARYNNK